MKKLITGLVIALVLVVTLLLMGPFFVLDEGQQALVLRFGQIQRVETTAGLKFKTPFLDNVVVYSKKILPWDGEAQRIPTREQQFIWVDVTARWRIVDPKVFYSSLTTMERAFGKLDDVIDGAVRTVVTSNYLREAVRNSNGIMQVNVAETFDTGDAEGAEALQELALAEVSYERIDKGRRVLAQEMLAIARQLAPEYGIEIIDIIPRQIRYSDELTESVYKRMIAERSQIAQAFRSYGEGKKAEWLGKLENEQRSVMSRAYETAEGIKGAADATATRIYAEAYGRDRAFFDFWRALESYKQTLPKFNKTLSTDMDYFRYMYSTRGR